MARYQKQRKQYPIGTVSSGTMRPEDLIPDFLWELKARANEPGVPRKQRKAHMDLYREISARMDAETDEDGEAYYASESADWDLASLFDALEAYAGPYFYFGAHPGDGCDYGYWLSEYFESEFDGLKVSDTSEIPPQYRGEVLHINDHGNMTLYVKTARALREIWSIV